MRSYSLSGAPSDLEYRISVKLEPDGAAGTYLHRSVAGGALLDVSEPRGGFTLQPAERPVVLLSAGIGATPVLAMLHALSQNASAAQVWWLHGARDGLSHAFADEVRQLLAGLAHGRGWTCYSRPAAHDQQGRDYDAAGRLSVQELVRLGVPRDSDFYMCGPPPLLADLRAGLLAWGVSAERLHSELFGGGPTLTPGVRDAPAQAPHQPSGAPGTGPLVSFARSGLTVRWGDGDLSLLELAEACAVPVRWSCRAGVCHNCESGLISGAVTYGPAPLDAPAEGNILICCSRPQEDVVIDL